MELASPDLERLITRLRKLDRQTYRALMLRIGARMGLRMEELVSLYPEPKKRTRQKVYTRIDAQGRSYLSAFKSQKQQGYVFWLISTGKVPYKRTGFLGRTLNSRARVDEDSVVIDIGSSAAYAEKVIGTPPEQALIHQNYWTPLQVDVEMNTPELVRFAQVEVENALKAYGLA